MRAKQTLQLLLLVLLSLGPMVIRAQGSWEVLDVPTDQHLRSVYFTDSLYGWAVGDTGTIIHTMDGGENWQVQDPGSDNNIINVFFLNRQTGWAVSWNYIDFFGTLILKTTDGGNTWNAEPYQDDNLFMNCILFLDSLMGWMGGSPHALVKTIDGGQSWTNAAIDTNALAFFPVLNVYFLDENYGYACGGMFDIAGVTWSTSNGGDLWIPIDNSDAPADEIHGLHIFDSLTVLGAGGDPDLGYGVAMIRTADGGFNWNYEELSMAGNAFDIDFRNNTEVWAPLGPGQKLIYSMDAGNTWTEISSPENTAIFDMIFPDSMHGYAVGYNGAFLKYKPLGVGVDDLVKNVHEFILFPNPSDGLLSVALNYGGEPWDEEMSGQGELEICNTMGKLVWKGQIQHSSERIDLSGIPAGIYVCKITYNFEGKDYKLQSKLILR